MGMRCNTEIWMMYKKSNILLLLLVCAAIWSSCLKTVTNNNKSNPSGVTFFNMVPYAPYFKVQVDGVTIGDTTNFPYSNAWSTNPPNYTSEFAGIHTISFLDDTGASLVTGSNVQFAANTKYSIWLFDTLNSFGLNAVQLSDSWDSIPYATCLIRFLNFSPTFTPVDVMYRNNGIDTGGYNYLYYSQSFMGTTTASAATLSTYMTFTPGNYTFVFHYSYDSTFTVVDSVKDTLVSAHGYTLFIGGLWDSTGTKAFTTGLIHMN
jgi:hypothetical protein